MNWASKVPNGMLDSWNGVIKFVNQRIAPVTAWSGGIITSSSGLFKANTENAELECTRLAEKYGTSAEVAKQIEKLGFKYFFEEDTSAGNDEARLCLKKGDSDAWLICDDYKEYVQSLLDMEKKRAQPESSQPKLKIQVYYAESDIMIGKGGQRYFEECWNRKDVLNVVDFESRELPGTNHETALDDHKRGALKSIFEEVTRGAQ